MILEDKRTALTAQLATLTADAETYLTREDFDPAHEPYVEIKREADKTRKTLAEIDEVITARQFHRPAASPPTSPDPGPDIVRQLVTEYPGYGRSKTYNIPDLRRALLKVSSLTDIPEYRYSGYSAPAASAPLLAAGTTINVDRGQTRISWITAPGGAPLAEVVAEGAQKPEAAITWTEATINLEVLAHWAKLSRQLYNVGGAYDFIVQELLRGVDDKMEALAAAAVAGASGTSTVAGDTMLQSIRLGVGKCAGAGFPADTVILNPADYADVDIDVMTTAGGAPESRSTFWGLNVIPAGAIPAGTAYVMKAKTALVTFRYPGVDLFMTDSDISGAGATAASDFRANILTALAETTAKSALVQPAAVCKCVPTPAFAEASARK